MKFVDPLFQFNPNHYQGVKCIDFDKEACSAQPPPSAVKIPYIFIGCYRHIVLCRKGHFKQVEYQKNIIKRLEFIYEQVQSSNDAPLPEFGRSGETHSISLPKCKGFLVDQKSTKTNCSTLRLKIFGNEQQLQEYHQQSWTIAIVLVNKYKFNEF
jgi:hypothetical protein